MFKRLVDKSILLWGLSPHILSAFQAPIAPIWDPTSPYHL